RQQAGVERTFDLFNPAMMEVVKDARFDARPVVNWHGFSLLISSWRSNAGHSTRIRPTASKRKLPRRTAGGRLTRESFSSASIRGRLLQLHRPVGIVEECLPRLVLGVRQLEVEQRAALGLLR